MWRVGAKLVHPFNPELGVGVVTEIEGRFLLVHFPAVGRDVQLGSQGSGLRPLVMPAGSSALVIETGESVEVAEALEEGRYRLTDGRELDQAELWPEHGAETPVERLAQLRIDPLRAFRNRLHGLELMRLREAGGLGSFLGGRIEIFPHQLHAARTAFGADPVRWLLADEVGLGKTVEACLLISALIRTGRAERVLVIAPSTLTIQWLGELYRKFHQVFVLLDHDRIEDVEATYGEGVNPFDVHPFAVASLEMLASDRRFLDVAGEAGLDAVVLDEAHRLARPEWTDAVGPLVEQARHAVLLTATPLQEDRGGFHRLFALLHPEVFRDFEAFDAALMQGEAVVPFTSAVRRADVGGLPPRAPERVDLGSAAEDIADDPRTAWIIEQIRGWSARREKALVFLRDVERVEALAGLLESRTGTRVSRFHENFSAAKRDIEIATFRDSGWPILLSSSAGGEGRNFQFCHRMVHFDLPDDPVELEQRIGRLDRIGRTLPVEIVYFALAGDPVDLAGLYERLGLFERPAAGLDPALAPVRGAIAEAREAEKPLDVDAVVARVSSARADHADALVSVLYRDAYTPERADEILAAVPGDLEDQTRRFCVNAAEDLGFDVVEKSERAMYYLEFGSRARIDSLPGVEGGARFLGTFDREEALVMEEADFFASGHPLVEGLLLELEDGVRGRAALFSVDEEVVPGAGLLLVYKRGAEFALEVVEADGTLRPEWVEPLRAQLKSGAKGARPDAWGLDERFANAIRELASHAGAEAKDKGELVAAAFFRGMDRT